ncbi:hypothetical protein [Umezawaea tangerina]|uniref:Excreted virulence factor EspC (Type VII ESX diderm) n=1 Tax=Umezawaea tangerina TaxID=84725 RepID=A0A2T0TLK8_9PSEU|nr:hypothetical protein [Umezawaea tangerina]PRY46539.1 hypothetical protein CLV43_101815 [Umezawaea tangerina]
MAAGFEVEPDDLDTFTKNIRALVDGLAESRTLLEGVHLDPLVFGALGRSFSLSTSDRVAEAADCIARYQGSIANAGTSTKATADTYRSVDQEIAESFKDC